MADAPHEDRHRRTSSENTLSMCSYHLRSEQAKRSLNQTVYCDGPSVQTDVSKPRIRNTSLNGNPVAHRIGKHTFLVVLVLTLEALEARHGYNSRAWPQFFSGLERVLELAPACQQNHLQRCRFLLCDIPAFENALAAHIDGNVVQGRQILPTERKQGRTFGLLKRRSEGTRWSDEGAQAADISTSSMSGGSVPAPACEVSRRSQSDLLNHRCG